MIHHLCGIIIHHSLSHIKDFLLHLVVGCFKPIVLKSICCHWGAAYHYFGDVVIPLRCLERNKSPPYTDILTVFHNLVIANRSSHLTPTTCHIRKAAKYPYFAAFVCGRIRKFGRSDRIRTCGIDVPNKSAPIFCLIYRAFRGSPVQKRCFRVLLSTLFPHSPKL